jgi:hypothetical protein
LGKDERSAVTWGSKNSESVMIACEVESSGQFALDEQIVQNRAIEPQQPHRGAAGIEA